MKPQHSRENDLLLKPLEIGYKKSAVSRAFGEPQMGVIKTDVLEIGVGHPPEYEECS